MPITEKVMAGAEEVSAPAHPSARTGVAGPGTERGSQTTEYALVMVVAATIAALALAWARQGAISGLLNAVLKQVRGMLGIG
jgi:hypothetical protein